MEPGPTEPRWEQPGAKPMLADVVDYRSAANDSTDGVTLRGVAKPDKRRDWTRPRTALIGMAFIGLSYLAIPDMTGWLVVTGLIVAGYAVGLVTYKPSRRTPWSAPIVVVNREGITVTDVAPMTSTGTWTELGKLRARSYERGGTVEIHLSWVTPGGRYVTANLGDTIDLTELRRAILTQAPPSMTFRLGARGAYGDD